MTERYDAPTYERGKELIRELTDAGLLPPAISAEDSVKLWDIVLRHMAARSPTPGEPQ